MAKLTKMSIIKQFVLHELSGVHSVVVCLCSGCVSPSAWSGCRGSRNCSAKPMHHQEHRRGTRFTSQLCVPFVVIFEFSGGSVVGHSSACHLLNVRATLLWFKQKVLHYILQGLLQKHSLFIRLIRWPQKYLLNDYLKFIFYLSHHVFLCFYLTMF